MFKLKKEVLGNAPGTIVYLRTGYDYGIAKQAEKLTGKPHFTVSVDINGEWYFVVPKEDLETVTLENLFNDAVPTKPEESDKVMRLAYRLFKDKLSGGN